jgi:hypothetical protein
MGTTCPQDLLFSAGVWWSWRQRNLMSLNSETCSSSQLSFNIRAMVETSRNCFSIIFNDRLDDRYIKWNNNNHSCAILNVDCSFLGCHVRFGFVGIVRNTFGHYLAGFSGFIHISVYILPAELDAIYKGLLLAKNMNIDELVCYYDSLHCIKFIKGPQVRYK